MSSLRKISNPLTIIAMFAGIAEISGTAVLTMLPNEIQIIFIWFVMGFPTLLILLFFLVLIFKPSVLYAPSDFSNDDNFLRINKIGSKVYEEKRELKEMKFSKAFEEIRLKIESISDKIDSSELDPLIRTIDQSKNELAKLDREPEFDIDDIWLMGDIHTRLVKGQKEEDIIRNYKKNGLNEDYLTEMMVKVVKPME